MVGKSESVKLQKGYFFSKEEELTLNQEILYGGFLFECFLVSDQNNCVRGEIRKLVSLFS
jgi:hypothetical protein